MLDLISIAAVRASVVLNYSWCGVRLDHRRREVGLTNDYPRLDESLSVLVERFPSLQPLAGAEFLNNGTLYPSMKAAIKTRQDKTYCHLALYPIAKIHLAPGFSENEFIFILQSYFHPL